MTFFWGLIMFRKTCKLGQVFLFTYKNIKTEFFYGPLSGDISSDHLLWSIYYYTQTVLYPFPNTCTPLPSDNSCDSFVCTFSWKEMYVGSYLSYVKYVDLCATINPSTNFYWLTYIKWWPLNDIKHCFGSFLTIKS